MEGSGLLLSFNIFTISTPLVDPCAHFVVSDSQKFLNKNGFNVAEVPPTKSSTRYSTSVAAIETSPISAAAVAFLRPVRIFSNSPRRISGSLNNLCNKAIERLNL
ncbi:MAG: Uncharacterised protein [Methanobacteriota archaeon]|nr:MAG: Uncharacterised protein [Euryarchaeota archaeon]